MDLLSEKVYVSGLTSLWPKITRIPNIPHYGKTPHFALYEDGELLTLTPYKKGAQHVARRMTELLQRIQALEEQLQASSPPGSSAVERLEAERQSTERRRR